MGEAVAHLEDEFRNWTSGDENTANILGAGFAVASNYHVHFYHRDMDLEGGNGQYFARAKEAVERFVESAAMVAISEALDAQ